MSTLFDNLDRLKSIRGNKQKDGFGRGNKRNKCGSQNQRKRVDGPNSHMIVVYIVNHGTTLLGARGRKTFDMRIEMRVDQPSIVVTRSARVNVLEWR
jgi:hypothetical protein